MISDLADDAPAECEYCGDPALDFITRWIALRPGHPPRRHYVYLCGPCITDAEHERDWSQAQ